MKVRSLAGKISTFPPTGYIPKTDDTRPRSELHLNARRLLREEFPTENLLEEIPIDNEHLFIDFYLPMRKWAIEINGEQHYKYIRHFHGNIDGFRKSRANDQRKLDWCILNNIRLIYFPYNKSVDDWRILLWD